MKNRNLRPPGVCNWGRRLFFVACLLFPACSSSPQRIPPIPNATVIFIPGFYGTALADALDGDRIFLTGTEAFFGSTPLGLPVTGVSIEGLRPLKIDGILESVDWLGGIFSFDVYGNALDRLKGRGGAEVVAFAYDWRNSLEDSVKRLADLVASLKKSGRTRIAIVAHSMGGLLASYYLRYGDQSFDSPVENWIGAEQVAAAVFMGVPFRGSNVAFRNLQIGTSLGRSDNPLSSESLGTFPSMYQLLPPSPSAAYVDPQGRPVSDRLTLEAWKNSRYGLFKPQVSDADLRGRERHVRFCLDRARKFRTAQFAVSRKKAPNISVLSYVGTGEPSLARAVWEGTEMHGRWWYSEAGVRKWIPSASVKLEEDGDGTVITTSARLPPAFLAIKGAQEKFVRVEHTEMPASDEIFPEVSEFLASMGF